MSGSVDEDELLGSFMAEISKIPEIVSSEAVTEGATSKDATSSIVSKPIVSAVAVAACSKPVYKSEDKIDPNSAATPSVNQAALNVYANPPAPSVAYPGTNAGANGNPFSFHSSTNSTVVIKKREKETYKRKAADAVWEDPTLSEWPENDFRLFVGDLAKETTEDMLSNAFKHYKSFAMCRVVRSKVDIKAKGYGFVSFLDPMDCAKALREMNGKYLGARPMKISKSNWADRDLSVVKQKESKKKKMEKALGLR